MKKIMFAVSLLCVLSFSLVSARTLALRIPSAKIDEFITQNPDLPDFDKNCLLTGEFQVGIRAETLKFMFGEPRSMKTVRQPWAVQEEWFYRIDRNRLYFTIENGGVVGIEER